MLTEICTYLKNFFVSNDEDKHYQKGITINGGILTPSFDIKQNQYYRIIGSTFNDGVHKFGDETDVLTDEVFDGSVWLMSVPKAFLDLVAEIEEYQAKYGQVTPYVSESFGGYSYSKSDATAASWQHAFGTRLNAWRKIL